MQLSNKLASDRSSCLSMGYHSPTTSPWRILGPKDENLRVALSGGTSLPKVLSSKRHVLHATCRKGAEGWIILTNDLCVQDTANSICLRTNSLWRSPHNPLSSPTPRTEHTVHCPEPDAAMQALCVTSELQLTDSAWNMSRIATKLVKFTILSIFVFIYFLLP